MFARKIKKILLWRHIVWKDVTNECLDWYDWLLEDFPLIARTAAQLLNLLLACIAMSIVAYTFQILHLPFDIYVAEEGYPKLSFIFTIAWRGAPAPQQTLSIPSFTTPTEKVNLQECQKLQSPSSEITPVTERNDQSNGKHLGRIGGYNNMRRRIPHCHRRWKTNYAIMTNADDMLDDMDNCETPLDVLVCTYGKKKPRKKSSRHGKVIKFATSHEVIPDIQSTDSKMKLEAETSSSKNLNHSIRLKTPYKPSELTENYEANNLGEEEAPEPLKLLTNSRSKRLKPKKNRIRFDLPE